MSRITASAAPAAKWWRADRYEVVHGTHIQPATGAKVEQYDVFGSDDRFWIGVGLARTAYVELVNLDLDDIDAVLNWCGRFGLLGVLHHQLVAAYFWPTWESQPIGSSWLAPKQLFLGEAVSFDVFPSDVRCDEEASARLELERTSTALSTPEVREVTNPERLSCIGAAHVHVRDLWSLDQQDVDIVHGYGQYFPDVHGIAAWTHEQAKQSQSTPWAPPPCAGDRDFLSRRTTPELNRARYPLPEGPGFVKQYAEPLHLFYRVVYGFRTALTSLADQAEGLDAVRLAMNLHGGLFVPAQLAVALKHATPSVVLTDEGWRLAWEVRSLLAAMSVMAIQDLAFRHGRLPICQGPGCKRRFFTERGDTKHCSFECGNRIRVSRHRQKRKSAPPEEDS